MKGLSLVRMLDKPMTKISHIEVYVSQIIPLLIVSVVAHLTQTSKGADGGYIPHRPGNKDISQHIKVKLNWRYILTLSYTRPAKECKLFIHFGIADTSGSTPLELAHVFSHLPERSPFLSQVKTIVPARRYW